MLAERPSPPLRSIARHGEREHPLASTSDGIEWRDRAEVAPGGDGAVRLDEDGFPDVLDAVHERVRRSRVGTVAGLLLGIAAGVVVFLVPGATDGLAAVSVGLSVAVIGLAAGVIGAVVGGGRLQRIVDSVRGYDLAAERIARSLVDAHVDLPGAERARATRFATISVAVLPTQIRTLALTAGLYLLSGVCTSTFPMGTSPPVTVVGVVVCGLLTASFVRLCVLRARALRRAEAYLAAERAGRPVS